MESTSKGSQRPVSYTHLDVYKRQPIVTVRMSNYKISVLGEVNSPGTFTINNEKVNIKLDSIL